MLCGRLSTTTKTSSSLARSKYLRGRLLYTRAGCVTILTCDREAQHNSESDPRDHLTCCNKYDDGSTSTEHYPIPKDIEKSDEKKTDQDTKKSSGKKPEKADKKK